MSSHYDYSGESTTVQVKGVFHKGKFCYEDTGESIEFRNYANVTITVLLTDVLKKDKQKYLLKREVVLREGTFLQFDLPKTGLTFRLSLLEDLTFRKINNKPAIAEDCKCVVLDASQSSANSMAMIPDFEPFEIETLNQAFFKTSVKFRPESISHTTNIYKSFRVFEYGRYVKLEEFRF